MKLKPNVVPKRYPVRFWLLVAYCIDMPSFVSFDASGRTHDVGLFNPTSLSIILLTLLTCGLLLTMTLLNRQKLLQRPVKFDVWAWLLLLANYILSTALTPPSRLTPAKPTDFPLSMFRLAEWILLFALLLSLYTREPEENATDLMTRLVGYVCWGQLIVVWVLFLFLPFRVYAVTDDLGSGHVRFGGGVTNPVYLAVMAGIAFFYALFFWQGMRRYFGCALAFLTLMLTYARGEQVLFLVALFTYLLILSSRPVHRWAGVLSILSTLVLAAAFSPTIIAYLERGQGLRNVLTLSERTEVWTASLKAFSSRPWLGYGFIIGVKNTIKDHWNATNWVPPYAHNEYIQALVTGGVFACVLDVYLHLRVLWLGLRQSRKDMRHTFFLVAFLQIFGMSFLTVTVSAAKDEIGAVFVLLFFGIVARPPARAVVSRPIPLRAFEVNRSREVAAALPRWRTPLPPTET